MIKEFRMIASYQLPNHKKAYVIALEEGDVLKLGDILIDTKGASHVIDGFELINVMNQDISSTNSTAITFSDEKGTEVIGDILFKKEKN